MPLCSPSHFKRNKEQINKAIKSLTLFAARITRVLMHFIRAPPDTTHIIYPWLNFLFVWGELHAVRVLWIQIGDQGIGRPPTHPSTQFEMRELQRGGGTFCDLDAETRKVTDPALAFNETFLAPPPDPIWSYSLSHTHTGIRHTHAARHAGTAGCSLSCSAFPLKPTWSSLMLSLHYLLRIV